MTNEKDKLQKTLNALGAKGLSEWDISLLRSYMVDEDGKDLRLSKNGYWRPSAGKSVELIEKERKLLSLVLIEPWGALSPYGKAILRAAMGLDYRLIESLAQPNHGEYDRVVDICVRRDGENVSLFFYGDFYQVTESAEGIVVDLTKMYKEDCPILLDDDAMEISRLFGAGLSGVVPVAEVGDSYDDYGGSYGCKIVLHRPT
jgi:hypothetical protein